MAVTRPSALEVPRSVPLALQVTEEVPPAEWDEEIRALGGSLYHTSAWSEFRAVDSAQSLFFRWSDTASGELVALAAGVRRPPRSSRRGRLASYALIESPPATRRAGLNFVDPLRRWATTGAGRPPLIEVQLGSFDARGEWAPGGPPGRLPRVEFLVGTLDPDTAIMTMRKNIRSQIRRAERLGVEVREGTAWDDLLVFARLYRQTAMRLLATKGVAPNREQPETRAAALQILARRGAARLYVAWFEGRPVAGCLFGVWDGAAYYLQNGADDRARTCGAVHHLLHHAIADFASQGYARVNLGGVPAEARDEASIDHGLYHFKAGFGTEPIACLGGSLVLRPGRARALAIARRQTAHLRALRARRP
jgi:hypothetical protein